MTLGSFYERFKYLGHVRQWKNNRQKKYFGLYSYVIVNLVPVIFNLESIWSLLLTH